MSWCFVQALASKSSAHGYPEGVDQDLPSSQDSFEIVSSKRLGCTWKQTFVLVFWGCDSRYFLLGSAAASGMMRWTFDRPQRSETESKKLRRQEPFCKCAQCDRRTVVDGLLNCEGWLMASDIYHVMSLQHELMSGLASHTTHFCIF